MAFQVAKIVELKLITRSIVISLTILLFLFQNLLFMRQLIVLFCLFILASSCDDGDVITVEFDFDDTFSTCGELVFYKIKSDPAESLSIQITSPATTLDDLLEVDANGILIAEEATFTINGSSNTFNYRTYNTTPTSFFCNDVPPSSITITSDAASTTGDVTITTVLTEDDEDGIPAEQEDLNNNGDLTDDDTDGDGIPNYIDEDDDGDNVLTATELIDVDLVDSNSDGDNDDDVDGDPLTDPVDTDGDGIPNYLDTDDDNDTVLTIDEENNTQDENPANDFTNPEIADYLNNEVTTTVAATAYREHDIQQSFDVQLLIENLQLPNITQDTFYFGTLEDSSTSNIRKITPEF